MESGRNVFTALLLLISSAPFAGAQVSPAIESAAYSGEEPESLPGAFLHVAQDQKRIWSAPASWQGRGKLLAAGTVMAMTGALVALDPVEARYFRGTTSFGPFNRAFSGNITGYATVAAPALLFATGLVFKDTKLRNTGLAAGEALVDAGIVTVVLKNVTRRAGPLGSGPGGWFQQSGTPTLKGNGSFPSGHTMSAFAVATVISRRYSNHRWVPWVAYGLAGTIGFSRMSTSAHFASDVFLGGALGYSIGRLKTPHRKAWRASSESLPVVP